MAEELVCRVPFKDAIDTLATDFTETEDTLLIELTEASEILVMALRIELSLVSILFTGLWYCDGRPVRNGGGVAAVRADSTMELISPVTLAEEAADCTAIANCGSILAGTF